MRTAVSSQIAEKFRKLAEGLSATIDDKRRPMTQNPTPKRMKEYQSRIIEGDNLERGQRALLALADAHDDGTVPEVLLNVRTKDEVLRLVRHGIDTSGGYYSIHSTGKYTDKSQAGIALQALLDKPLSPVDQAAKEERERRQTIERLIEEVRFTDIPGFYPTPRPVIDIMLNNAMVRPGNRVLEPSAGLGCIVDALLERIPRDELFLDVIEIRPSLCKILGAKGHHHQNMDFMEWCDKTKYDRILMNPPFERGQDAEHIRRAFHLLLPGGRLVAILGASFQYNTTKVYEHFRHWLEGVQHTTFPLPDGAFDTIDSFRRTGVKCWMLIADKT